MAYSGMKIKLCLRPNVDYDVELLSEGISLILGQWTALHMAVSNEGKLGDDNLELLQSNVVSFFTDSKDPIVKDDLADFLAWNVFEFFNTDLVDESPVEVAAELLNLHKDLICWSLKSTIEKLRKKSSACASVSKSIAMVTEMCGGILSDDGTLSQIDDKHNNIKGACDVGDSNMAVDEEGWSLVSSKRNKGKRH